MPTETIHVLRQIKQILIDDLQLKGVPDAIPDDYSLLEGGLALDSILIAELLARIEDTFGMQFEEHMLEANLFNNLSLLAAFVARECGTARRDTREVEP